MADLAKAERIKSDPVLSTFVSELREMHGQQIEALWLFGSRARGEGAPESDYDVCTVVGTNAETIEASISRREIPYPIFRGKSISGSKQLESFSDWNSMQIASPERITPHLHRSYCCTT